MRARELNFSVSVNLFLFFRICIIVLVLSFKTKYGAAAKLSSSQIGITQVTELFDAHVLGSVVISDETDCKTCYLIHDWESKDCKDNLEQNIQIRIDH